MGERKSCDTCRYSEVSVHAFPCCDCVRGYFGVHDNFESANSSDCMKQKDYDNYKKVVISQFFEELSQFVWKFIDNLDTDSLDANQCKDLMDKLSDTFIANTETNKQFVKYQGKFFLLKINEVLKEAVEEGEQDE